jgi:hypothetical protein
MKREEYIKNFKGAEKIAEIGVLRGLFSKHLEALNPKELHLIDTWKVWDEEFFDDYKNYNQLYWDRMYNNVLSKFSSNDLVKIHRLSSEEAVKNFPDNYFDLIYIDANHSYSFVKQDIELWLPKIKKGGILSGHDYDSDGVSQAVNELLDKNKLTITPTKGIQSWFYKK